MKIFLLILSCYFQLVINERVKIFIPNTNFWNPSNWREKQVPCGGNHIVFPKKSPKIFLNGISKQYHLTDIILPENGELILDDQVSITAAQLSNEVHDCDSSVSHYNKIDPDRWYNPANWCEAKSMTSHCLIKPLVEASIVPSASDFVVFPPQNSFFVGVASWEPKILVSRIYYRGITYSNSLLFRQKIRKTFSNQNCEIVTINSNAPPQIELQGNRCKNNTCAVNSNLQRMDTICKYVSCKDATIACKKPVKPIGSCCNICGNIIRIVLLNQFIKPMFTNQLDSILNDIYKTRIGFSLLSTKTDEFQLTIAPISQALMDFQQLTLEILEKINQDSNTLGIKFAQCQTCEQPLIKSGITKAFLGIILIILIVIFIGISLVLIKRYRPAWIPPVSFVIPRMPNLTVPKINFNCFQNPFAKSRLEEQYDDSTVTSSTFTSIFPGGVEAIELPDKINEVSFDNPIYSSGINDSKQ